MSDNLSDFEGLPVRQAGAEVRGLEGGLRDSIKIDPEEFHHGERVILITEAEVGKLRFDPIDKDDPAGDQRRVHIFQADGTMIFRATDVPELRGQMDDHRKRIADAKLRAKEKEEGVARLPTDDEAEKLGEEHADGDHAAGLVPGCPECENEAAAEAEEANEPVPIAGRAKKASGLGAAKESS